VPVRSQVRFAAAPAVAAVVLQYALAHGAIRGVLQAAVDGQVDDESAGIQAFAVALQQFLAASSAAYCASTSACWL